jgi:hypothetical protein
MPQHVHITFIHGLANKPAPEDLRRIWLEALKSPIAEDPGFDLGAVGVTNSFIYWADLFYDTPITTSDYESRNDELADSVKNVLVPEQNEWTDALLQKLGGEEGSEFEDAPVDDNTDGFERIPLPWILKKEIMRHFVKEAHDYLFNINGIRDTIRKRAIADLNQVPPGSRHVLVGHSQGTFIAYDVLTGVPGFKQIDGFLTLGSPLGLDEVQDRLESTDFPDKLHGDWVNVYDPFDVVARLDPKLANDFKKNGVETIIDVMEENWGRWRHSATKYFKRPKLRNHLRRLCCREE